LAGLRQLRGLTGLTLAVAGLLATLSSLAFAVDYLLAHPWKFALAIAALIVVGALLHAYGKWAELKSWARTAAAGIEPEKVATEWAEELKHASDQSVDTFKATAVRLRG
jgi:hypothetical protein